jgi:hypothetical protein
MKKAFSMLWKRITFRRDRHASGGRVALIEYVPSPLPGKAHTELYEQRETYFARKGPQALRYYRWSDAYNTQQ